MQWSKRWEFAGRAKHAFVPALIIASGLVSRAMSGMISGSGFARARMIGLSAIAFRWSGVKTFGAERPRNRSAPLMASSKVRKSVWRA